MGFRMSFNKYALVTTILWETELTGDPNAEHAADVMRRTAGVLDDVVTELKADGVYHSYCESSVRTIQEVRAEVINLVGWKSEIIHLLRKTVEDTSYLIETYENDKYEQYSDDNYKSACLTLLDHDDLNKPEIFKGLIASFKSLEKISTVLNVKMPVELKQDLFDIFSIFKIKLNNNKIGIKT